MHPAAPTKLGPPSRRPWIGGVAPQSAPWPASYVPLHGTCPRRSTRRWPTACWWVRGLGGEEGALRVPVAQGMRQLRGVLHGGLQPALGRCRTLAWSPHASHCPRHPSHPKATHPSLQAEARLCARIAELQEYRALGLRTFEEVDELEASGDRPRRKGMTEEECFGGSWGDFVPWLGPDSKPGGRLGGPRAPFSPAFCR